MGAGRTRRVVAMVVGSVLLATACGDDDDAAVDDVDVGAVEDVGSDDAEAEAEPEADNEAAAPGGGGGMLVLDGEEIELGPGLCFLEEQPSAGGGGSILATAQAQGTDAAGEEVRIDFTRYSEDSQFAGDDVSVDVGALGESVGYSGSDAEGTVSIDGNVVSATDFPLMSFDDGSEIAVTFTISC